MQEVRPRCTGCKPDYLPNRNGRQWGKITHFVVFVGTILLNFFLSLTFVSDSLINNRITRIDFYFNPTKILTMFLFFS
ncbi:MAG: hypothetical protein BGO33_00835 [Bacteroidia bacterium 43-41]|nr:MAG: hypothetical protein BGO33_00835 [Bacteroidia bacterium 43-41]